MYGTETGVALYVPRIATAAGEFDDTTTPTKAAVVTFLEQISSILDGMLSQQGFAVPITETTVIPMLTMFVEQEVASMVEGINGSGRFGPTTGEKGPGKSRFSLMMSDIIAFVEQNAVGLERMGATRSTVYASGIGFRGTNEAGDDTFPLFERDRFGPDGFFTDADT